jgi:hypothetical protein
MRASASCEEAGRIDDRARAHCAVVTARRQSRLQQSAARNEVFSDSLPSKTWQWRTALRTQHARCASVVAAHTAGARLPRIANANNSLAVCRRIKESGV